MTSYANSLEADLRIASKAASRGHEAQAELARRELARRHFMDYCTYLPPEFLVNTHHRYISECLERAERREPGWTRLIFHEPPQHGKSEQITKRFSSWYLGRNPDHPAVITGYNDTLASGFGRGVRNYVNSQEFQNIFPNVKLAQDSKAAGRWNIAMPYRGSLLATGIFGGITGHGAKLLIIDDPIKNPDEAENKDYRERLQLVYQTVLSTRLHDDAIVIVVMTRWHQDDLSGWLLNQEDEHFRYICLPAMATRNDPLGRRVHGPLWAFRKSQPALIKQKKLLGSYLFDALYQGNPRAYAGKLFKRDYFQIIKRSELPKGLEWVRYWDLAIGEKDKDSYTASARAAIDEDGVVYFDGWIHGRWQWPMVRALISQVALMEGSDVLVGIEAAGQQRGMVQECHQDQTLVHVGILGVPVHQSKRVRALPVMARGESKQIRFVEGVWNDMVIDEAVEFDKGSFDDNVDVLSGCFKMLASQGADLGQAWEQLDREEKEQKELTPEQREAKKQETGDNRAPIIPQEILNVLGDIEPLIDGDSQAESELPWYQEA